MLSAIAVSHKAANPAYALPPLSDMYADFNAPLPITVTSLHRQVQDAYTHATTRPCTHRPPIMPGLNKYSARITQPKSQGASQAMLYATGLEEEDMNRPQVYIPM